MTMTQRLIETAINAAAHALGYDIFVSRCDGARTDGIAFDSLPAFGRASTSDGFEAWGFGLHLVVSRLWVHPQST